MLYYLLLTLSLVLAVCTFLPIWRTEVWWVRGLDFPRMQFFVLAAGLLVLDFVFLDISQVDTWVIIVLTASCLLYHAWWIVPYTAMFPVEVKWARPADGVERIKIMTANVLTSNRNADDLLALVRECRPDILVTLESDAWWQSRLDSLEPEYGHAIKCPLDNLYGMHVYSKLPLADSHIKYLVEGDVPSMHTLVQLPSGRKVCAHFLHPAPPSPTENEESAERDAELIVVAKRVEQHHLPVILTGDLNDVAWSATTRLFRKISGLLDPRIGRGMYNTYHARHWFMRWPLDHLFHSDHFTLGEIRRLRGFGSDHFALFTELVYEGGRQTGQDGLEADHEDRSWAEDKIEDQQVRESDVPKPG